MVMHTVLLATYTGTSATYAAATTGGDYICKTNGRIRQLTLVAAATAATSLIEGASAKMKKAGWAYDQEIEISAAGLRTAPAFPVAPTSKEVDLPISKGDSITIEFRHYIGTVVTPVLHLLAVIEESA